MKLSLSLLVLATLCLVALPFAMYFTQKAGLNPNMNFFWIMFGVFFTALLGCWYSFSLKVNLNTNEKF